MPDNLNNGLGPIKFTVEGSFIDKPRLLMYGAEVPYDSLHISYTPAETFKYTDHEGKEQKEEYPEYISLSFSLSGKIGQLEANVSYRVKANEAGSLVFVVDTEAEAAKKEKPDFFKKKDKKDDKESPKDKEGKDKKDDKDGKKPDFKKLKKGKSYIQADPGTRIYTTHLYQAIVESMVEDNE